MSQGSEFQIGQRGITMIGASALRESRSESSERIDLYAVRSRRFCAERQRLERVGGRITHIRAATFLLGVASWIAAYDVPGGPVRSILIASGTAFGLVFLILLVVHERVRRQIRLQSALEQVNNQACSRVRRDWEDIPTINWISTSADHPYAADLDLFGHTSLFKLVNTAATIPGRQTVRDWLLQPARDEQISRRQEAVAELAPRLDLRDEFAARARNIGRENPRAFERFLVWAEGDRWLTHKPALIWFSRVLPAVTITLIAMNVVGLVPYFTWVLTIGVGLVVTRRTRAPFREILEKTSSADVSLARYGPLFDLLATASFTAPLLRQMEHELRADDTVAAKQLKRLERTLACADVRHSHFLHVSLHALFLWDVHVVNALESWQREAGPYVRHWVSVLGEFEALSSLAALTHAHPNWAFAGVSDLQECTLVARQIGHPLLPPGNAVVNDVTIGPPGTFLFVTGSNMSGKSTLLRAIGLNVVLAAAGAPVFASAMRVPAVRLYTIMRVTDSLEHGVSQFMAQLERIKVVVEAARAARGQAHTLLYLFDEVMQGTNSSERLVAVRHILGELIQQDAIGAVASHDLVVPEADGLSTACRPVQFREEVRSTSGATPTMSFDYVLRPGLATSTNALKLMEIMGLKPPGTVTD